MIKLLLHQTVISCLLVGVLAIQPVLSQEIEESDETTEGIIRETGESTTDLDFSDIDLSAFGLAAADLDSNRLLLPTAERQLWQKIETEGSLDLYDKRLLTQTLPYLVSPETGLFNQIQAETIRGYYEDRQKISRLFPGADQESQRHRAKAGVIRSLGSTSCGSESLFARLLDPAKPLWVHYQLEQPAPQTPVWPFGRNFDKVARQFFWLEGRAFANRAITPTGWQDFLAQLAIGEIEERLALRPGALANLPIDGLPTAIAEARIAANLGLPILPSAQSEESFYADLGRRQLELAFQLPTHSLVGKNWRAIYQQIGFRVLEEELGLPAPASLDSVFETALSLTDNPRFQALAAELTERSEFYQDRLLAFNLPSELELPSGGESPLDQRLINGDPEAFALAGAWFLADSLDLSPNDSQTFVRLIAAGQNRPISLASAKAFDVELSLTTLFSAETTEEERQTLFERLGRGYETAIKGTLPRLNEAALLAIVDANQLPTLSTVLTDLTNPDRRSAIVAKLAAASAEEADYPNGLTFEALVGRGQVQLAETLGLTPTELTDLQAAKPSATARATGAFVDQALGWPAGTAFDLAQQTDKTSSIAAKQLQEKRLLQTGANRLWDFLRLTGRLKTALDELYFNGVVTSDLTGYQPEFEDETIATEEMDETPEEQEGDEQETAEEAETDTETDDELGEDQEFTDETVELAIPVEYESLANALKRSLVLPLAEIELLITGHWLPGLRRASFGLIGVELGQSSNLTGEKLIEAWKNSSQESAKDLRQHGQIFDQSSIVPNKLADELKNSTAANLSRTIEDLAVYQWNITCLDKRVEAKEAINRLIKTLIDLPEIIDGATTEDNRPNRPVQMITYSVADLADTTRQAIDQAYPGANGLFRKWGVYRADRAWDMVYIGY